ncbi:MAG: NusG domain II-containing protein [Mobilitalea sp.]
MIKKNDLILIGVIILLGVAVIIFMNAIKTEGSKVVITIDGNVYDTLELKEDTTYTVEVDNGVWNTFEIKDGYVNMLDASCPDKLCVKHNDIHYDHETIVCLPNKVVLEVIDGEENEIDTIAN